MTTGPEAGGGYDVSVVISTHNRSRDLAAALEALLHQEGGVPYEVLVVDNNSSDDTRIVVERAAAAASVPLTYLFEPRLGVSYGRNTGVGHAKAPIIAFTDDDCRPAPDWVAAITRAFERHPDIDCIGGRVSPIWPETIPSWFTRRQGSPLALCEHGDTAYRVDAENAATCLITANLACRRSAFDKAGPFSPEYPRGQDREIQMRMWRAGCRGLYDPSVSVAVPIPPERLTKRHFRGWYTRYGAVHARLELLERIDRDGRLVEPSTNRRFFGTAPHVYRSFFSALFGWLTAVVLRREVDRFFYENRLRYLGAYLLTGLSRHREAERSTVPAQFARLVSSRFRRPTPPL